MPTLNIQGQKVTVDDSFMSLSPDDQNKTVEEISGHLGIAPVSSAPASTSPSPSVAPQADPSPAQQPDTFQRSTILPLGKDTKTGEISLAVPGIIKGLFDAGEQAVTAPGRAMSGDLQVMGPDGNVTPQAIGEGLNFAGLLAGGTPAAGSGATIAAQAAEKAGPQAFVQPGMEAAAAAARLGVDLPRIVASDSPTVAQLGKNATSVPFAGTPIKSASQNAIQQLGQAADTVQAGYGTGDVAGAGAAVRQGVTDYGTKTLPGQVSDAYNAVDALIDPSIKTPLTATQQKAAEIVSRRNNATLGDGQAATIVKDATQPTPAVPAPTNPIGFTAKIPDAVPEAGAPTPNPGLNYHGIKDLRTNIGEMINDPRIAPQGTSQAELKQIYGSLSDDLASATENAGGEVATQAWKDANSLAKATADERQSLDRLIAPQSDEGLFSKLHAMAGTNSSADLAQLARARKAVSTDTWNEVASGLISKMGRDADGNFSPDRFITAYGKLSQNGKNLMFRSTGKGDLANSLEDIATVSRKFKDLNQYANPSGTGGTLTGIGLMKAALVAPVTTLGGLVGGRMVANLLSKPVSAKAIAAYSNAYQRALTAPSAEASMILGNTARGVAAVIANQGGPEAKQLVPMLSQVQTQSQ